MTAASSLSWGTDLLFHFKVKFSVNGLASRSDWQRFWFATTAWHWLQFSDSWFCFTVFSGLLHFLATLVVAEMIGEMAVSLQHLVWSEWGLGLPLPTLGCVVSFSKLILETLYTSKLANYVTTYVTLTSTCKWYKRIFYLFFSYCMGSSVKTKNKFPPPCVAKTLSLHPGLWRCLTIMIGWKKYKQTSAAKITLEKCLRTKLRLAFSSLCG